MVRKFILSLVVITMLFYCSAYAQTLDDIINKNIESHGGLAKMKEIKSVRMTGKLTMAQGMEAPIVYIKKRPNLLRVEMTVQGLSGVQAYDGANGWYIMPFMSGNKDPQKMTAEDLQDVEEQADFDGPLVNYKDKGNTIELVGTEDVEGTPTHKLKMTLKNGQVRYLFLDKETGLELKGSAIVKREGVERTVESFFGDYKNVDGMVYPFSIEIKTGGNIGQTYTIDKVEHNVELNDSMFKMPAAGEQTQPAQ